MNRKLVVSAVILMTLLEVFFCLLLVGGPFVENPALARSAIAFAKTNTVENRRQFEADRDRVNGIRLRSQLGVLALAIGNGVAMAALLRSSKRKSVQVAYK